MVHGFKVESEIHTEGCYEGFFQGFALANSCSIKFQHTVWSSSDGHFPVLVLELDGWMRMNRVLLHKAKQAKRQHGSLTGGDKNFLCYINHLNSSVPFLGATFVENTGYKSSHVSHHSSPIFSKDIWSRREKADQRPDLRVKWINVWKYIKMTSPLGTTKTIMTHQTDLGM